MLRAAMGVNTLHRTIVSAQHTSQNAVLYCGRRPGSEECGSLARSEINQRGRADRLAPLVFSSQSSKGRGRKTERQTYPPPRTASPWRAIDVYGTNRMKGALPRIGKRSWTGDQDHNLNLPVYCANTDCLTCLFFLWKRIRCEIEVLLQ